ncbi:hypothetical protein [Kitasatospora sp. NPDC047058]|uniref:hypothetical protein n=1 Tax=Kitasatospora sp. NPDC047058 TaxID=3155620 RepID=UPI0033DA9E99
MLLNCLESRAPVESKRRSHNRLGFAPKLTTVRFGRYSFQLSEMPGGLRPVRDPDHAEQA